MKELLAIFALFFGFRLAGMLYDTFSPCATPIVPLIYLMLIFGLLYVHPH